jgi:hypothetical protein
LDKISFLSISIFSILCIFTVCFADLGILNLPKICNGGLVLGLKPASVTSTAASKIYAPNKKGQN